VGDGDQGWKGSLYLPVSLDAYVEIESRLNGYESLPIHRTHLLRTLDLPLIHRDPFDRLLVAQVLIEDLTIVTRDPAISGYPVKTLW